MSVTVINAMPQTINPGVQDFSSVPTAYTPEQIPTHLPHMWTFAPKGPTTPMYVSGASLTGTYGVDVLDERGKYATHQTPFINVVNAQGNAIILERVKPDDAGPNANVRLWLDVLQTQVPQYERNPDHTFKLDEDGLKIPTGTTVTGYQVKFVTTRFVVDSDGETDFGKAVIGVGDQINQATATQSVRVPILDLQDPDFGDAGNNKGFRLWAPLQSDQLPIDTRIIQNQDSYTFRIGVSSRATSTSTATITETLSGAQYVDFSFKPGLIDINTGVSLYLARAWANAYSSNVPGTPRIFGPLSNIAIYDANIKTYLELFAQAEEPFFSSTYGDFNPDATAQSQAYRFNFVSGLNSDGVPYHSFIINTDAVNATRLSERSVIYAGGGSDGTMNDEVFAELVSRSAQKYLTTSSQVAQDDATFPQSVVYDSGFPLATKFDLAAIISARKDIVVFLSTYDALGTRLTAVEESAIATALRTRVQAFPESTYFGTPAYRAFIVGRNGQYIGGQYEKRLPLTLELARNNARYMGAANGKWKNGFAFGRAPLNRVTQFVDVNIEFAPATVRNQDWANGMIYVQKFDMSTFFFPGLQTVFDEDTSVLNSYFAAFGVVETTKVGVRAWRQFTGADDLTDSQLVEGVNEYVQNAVEGKFDDRFIITSNAQITANDAQRGYSWTNPIDFQGNVTKTVQTLWIRTSRIGQALPSATVS